MIQAVIPGQESPAGLPQITCSTHRAFGEFTLRDVSKSPVAGIFGRGKSFLDFIILTGEAISYDHNFFRLAVSLPSFRNMSPSSLIY
jgi:hypothetical protein